MTARTRTDLFRSLLAIPGTVPVLIAVLVIAAVVAVVRGPFVLAALLRRKPRLFVTQ